MTRSFPTLVLSATLALGLSVRPASAQTTDYDAEIDRLAAHPAVQRAMELIEANDARTISMGIPSFTIGGGGVAGNGHSRDEWFVNEDGPLGIQRALLILVSPARIPGVS